MLRIGKYTFSHILFNMDFLLIMKNTGKEIAMHVSETQGRVSDTRKWESTKIIQKKKIHTYPLTSLQSQSR